jgi:hypothetical protein
MTSTTIDVFQQAAQRGLRLKAVGSDLHVNPGRGCSPDFAETLREHKPRLLSLLQLPFVMVYSERLGETLFFCEDEAAKARLVEAGACEWSIYTKAELCQLVQQNRIAPLSPAELRKVHEIKRTFRSRIATDNGG